jgi:hypothetical protein
MKRKSKQFTEDRMLAGRRDRVRDRGGAVLAPSEQTLPQYKRIDEKGGGWHSEQDGVVPLLDLAAGPGKPPSARERKRSARERKRQMLEDLAREHERQLLEWIELARDYSATPECVAAVQSLRREYRRQIAEFRRWRRRTDFVRECWVREYQTPRKKSRRPFDPNKPIPPTQLHQPAPPTRLLPNLPLLKPRPGERDTVDPRLMQWAGDLGRHVLAQDDPVAALERLLGEKQAGRKAVNTKRDQEITAAVDAKRDAGMTFEHAVRAVAADYGRSEDRVRMIYSNNHIEAKAARHRL